MMIMIILTQISSFVHGSIPLKLDTPNPVRLTWNKISGILRTFVTIILSGEGSYLSSKSITYEVPSGNNYLEVFNLIPGKTYLYGVYGISPTGIVTISESSFTTTGQVRMIKVPYIGNIRDIGGWTAENGKKVKYGLIYRGSEFNPVAEGSIGLLDVKSRKILVDKYVGIKGEIDLRGGLSYYFNTRNDTSIQGSLLGSEISYTASSYVAYTAAITSGTTINTIISTLISNLQNNKPTYIHCAGGCDRTGTLIALILGLCGVSESDLTKDYELTSFSGQYRSRDSSDYDYSGMIAAIKTYSGNTFQDKVISFLTTDGNVNSSDITTLKELLLE